MEIKKGNLKIFIGDDENNPQAYMTYYFKTKSVIVIDHTFVVSALRGQNIANRLFLFIVKMAEEEGWKIIPLCSYVVSAFEKHSELHHLLAK